MAQKAITGHESLLKNIHVWKLPRGGVCCINERSKDFHAPTAEI